ncbi:efflux RND transporter periplasmic adaptor subunit [Planctomicrobium sp. SH668]|uniref:efflux RND transporter periplasmic adaptor subunit n=1 Tax=Planctomicrobium sp. SH668 TaxID=3448126 RepID=UPI003F5CA417
MKHISITALSVALLFSFGCSPPNAYRPSGDPVAVYDFPIVKPVTSYVSQTGTTQAVERVELRNRVAGILLERNFEDGDFVKKGDLLFVIDEEPFIVKLNLAKAKLDEANANLKKAEQSKAREIALSQLQLNESELQLAKLTHERSSGLLGQNATSRQEFDRTEAALKKGEALILTSKAQLDQANSDYQTDILSAKSAVELANAEIQAATIDLGYCRIHAPIDGFIDRRTVDKGNYVKADSDNVLASIVRTDSIYAYVSINEADLFRLKSTYPEYSKTGEDDPKKIPVLMTIGDTTEPVFNGWVDYVSPSVKADAGTVQIRGVFENPGMLMPGMFVRIRIPSETNDKAMLVFESSIGYDQAGAFVYLINDQDVIERRSVELGDTVDGMRVVAGDFDEKSRIVKDGLLKVRVQLKVTPMTQAEFEEMLAEQAKAAQAGPPGPGAPAAPKEPQAPEESDSKATSETPATGEAAK